MKNLVLAFVFVFLALPALAQEPLLIASGAGYKPVVEALVKAYTAQSGATVERIYGNMAEVMSQAKNSGKVDMIVGEDNFLRKASMPLGTATHMGQGRMVLAWPKGKNAPENLQDNAIQRIAMPDAERAIYGKAAMEYLTQQGIYDALKNKLIVVGTVPQVFTYLSTGEVDAGFMNLTQALAGKTQLGGFKELAPETYAPIHITCFQMQSAPHKAAAENFATFLETEQAQQLLHEAGL